VHIERELKFLLAPGSFARLAAKAPRRRSLVSIYYDTPDRRLQRAGVALRLRRDGARWLQTLKAEGDAGGGLAQRAEWEMPVRGRALELGAFPRDEVRRATGVDVAGLARRLRPVFETRFVRRSGLVRLKAGGEAELAIDRGRITAGGRHEAISEVELELRAGEPDALLRFAAGLGLALAFESKAERGYRLAAGTPRSPRKWRMPALGAASTPAEAFAALFAAALTQAGSNADGFLRSDDPEYLHQMRVGLRRARSALRAFAPILRRAKPVKRDLRALMPILGAARDWDVLMATMPSAKRGRRAARARAAARAAVASPRFREFFLRALRWLHSQPRQARPPPLERFAARALERLHRRALSSRLDSGEHRHRLRIRVKRLRYACDFFAPCFAPAAQRPYLRELERLQDVLGALQDIVVGRRLLGELGVDPPGRLARRERRLSDALAVSWEAFARRAPYWRPAR
jgi:inorganic triphosphatase YgiF